MVFTHRLNILSAFSNFLLPVGVCRSHAQIQVVTISVDQFSFFLGTIYVDRLSLKQFDWKRRFYMVQIICRGPLYLRRDSRRRIIHGDLKPCLTSCCMTRWIQKFQTSDGQDLWWQRRSRECHEVDISFLFSTVLSYQWFELRIKQLFLCCGLYVPWIFKGSAVFKEVEGF